MKVSIIIPVYNVEKYLSQCLDSAVNQTLSDIEVIAINDGSTDGSLNILRDYEKRYENLKVINKENGGLSSARNMGLKIAKGEYIYFLDSDDYILHNNIIEYCYNLAKDHYLDIISFDAIDIKDEDGQLYQLLDTKSNRKSILESVIKSGEDYFIEANEKDAYKYEVCLNFYNRANIFNNNLLFFEERVFEDVPFSIISYVKAQRVLYVPYEFYFRRIREGSITSNTSSEKMIDSLIKNGEAIGEFYLENKTKLKDITTNILISKYKECYESALRHCNMIITEEENREFLKRKVKGALNSLQSSKEIESEIKVSIIVPVYNVEKYLRQCLDSAVNQTLDNLEIIAVNDGSTDGSLQILNEYAEKYCNLKIINKENGGLSSARNAGFEQAKGRYIYFLDSDDWLRNNDIIEYCYNTARYHSLDIISFDYIDMYDDGYNIHKLYSSVCSRKDKLESRIIDGETFYNECKEKSALRYVVWLNLYKKKFLEENHLIFQNGRIYEDVPFSTCAFIKANRILYVPYQFYFRRVRAGSITALPQEEKNIISLIENAKDIKKFYLENKDILKGDTKKNLSEEINQCLESAIYHYETLKIGEEKSKVIKNEIQVALKEVREDII